MNKKNEDNNDYLSISDCSSRVSFNDFKIIKLVGKGSFGKVN
jgi:hypothetical protein